MDRLRSLSVYLAGPVTSAKDMWRENAARILATAGIATFDPGKPYAGIDPKTHGRWVQRIDRMVLRECDVVLACLDPVALGTCREIEYARQHGKPVYAFGLGHVGCFASDLFLYPTMLDALNAILEGLTCRKEGMSIQDTGGCS